jgi:hypothetical protein
MLHSWGYEYGLRMQPQWTMQHLQEFTLDELQQLCLSSSPLQQGRAATMQALRLKAGTRCCGDTQ